MSTKTAKTARAAYRTARLDLGYARRPDLPPPLRAGDTVFVAWVSDEHGRFRPHTAVSLTPWRTNMSREEVEEGWCGSTDGVEVEALGRGIVVDDYGRVEAACDVGYPSGGAPYRSLRVRLAREGEDLPRTFARVAPESERAGCAESRLERLEDAQ